MEKNTSDVSSDVCKRVLQSIHNKILLNKQMNRSVQYIYTFGGLKNHDNQGKIKRQEKKFHAIALLMTSLSKDTVESYHLCES